MSTPSSNGKQHVAYVAGLDQDAKAAISMATVLGRGDTPTFGPIALADLQVLCTLGPAAILSNEYAAEVERLGMRAVLQLPANAPWIPHLRPYDQVVFTTDLKIVSVSGLLSPELLVRRPYLGSVGNFNAKRRGRPPQKMLPLDAYGSHAMRILQLIAVVGKGHKVVIRAPGASGKTYFVIDLLQTLVKMQKSMPKLHIVSAIINERTEDMENITAKVFSQEEHAPLRVHRPFSSMDNLNLVSVYYTAITTLSIALRLTEAGQDVVVSMDSMSRIAEALTGLDHLNKTGQTGLVSGGLGRDALVQTRAMAALGGDYTHILGEGDFAAGTMTVFATALAAERGGKGGSDPSETAYAREISGTAHTGYFDLVNLNPKPRADAPYPWVNVLTSMTRFQDIFVPPVHMAEMAKVRTEMAAMGDPDAQFRWLHTYADARPIPDWVTAGKKQ